MGLKLVLMTLVMIQVIVQSKSDNVKSETHRENYFTEHLRVKRARYYYSGHPNRLYRRPPLLSIPKGYYSATPPPGYYVMDEETPYAPYPRPSKVSTRSTNEALGDGDITNLVKYLTKQDLDKIIEFAGEKDKYRAEATDIFNNEYINPHKQVQNYNENNQHDDNEKFSLNGPYISNNQNENQFKVEYNNPNIEYDTTTNTQTRKGNNDNTKFSLNDPYLSENQDKKSFKIEYYGPDPNTNEYDQGTTQPRIMNTNYNAAFSNPPLEPEENMKNYELSYVNANKFNGINKMLSKDGDIFTDSSMMKEEVLPPPVNLRPDIEHEVAYTSKVTKVVQPESSSYEVEDFGDLPLMNYHNSKLHTVSSYNVPHYTITSPRYQPAPPHDISSDESPPGPISHSSSVDQVPEAVAKAHSDAHLKAVRIWTHRSKGTAYTLYNDGTLALEAPSRPKYRHP